MDISTTPQSSGLTGPTPATPPAARDDGPVISSDFETFLKMLTVQMENQDPLNPIQSSDFATQLATFSGVEQQVRTNELLESMAASQSLGGLSEVASWVGKEARAAVAAEFTGDPVAIAAKLPLDADQATLVVRNEAGVVVSRVAVSSTGKEFSWDGTDASGAKAPEGRYSFTFELAAGGKPLPGVTGEVYATIREVRMENGAPVLVFPDGSTVSPGDVMGLRDPGGV